MNDAISNTSPLLYLYRTSIIDWLPKLFNDVWAPDDIRERVLKLADEN